MISESLPSKGGTARGAGGSLRSIQKTLCEFAVNDNQFLTNPCLGITTNTQKSQDRLSAELNSGLEDGGLWNTSKSSPSQETPSFPPILNLDTAYAYARYRLSKMPLGARITIAGIYKGRDIVNSNGVVNNRLRGRIARRLVSEKRIRAVGVTTQDQEKRNFGLATKWEVLENE